MPMADNQAEEDDERFGDFTFASFPNQSFPSLTNSNDDDDDWGDFVNYSNQINGGFSKPSPPFGASLDPTDKHTFHLNNNNNSIKEIEKPTWKKPQGAIPLSIFGEEEQDKEEEEEQENHLHFGFGDASNVFSNKSNPDSVKNGSDSNGSVGIGDLISNLYNQRNGSISISGANRRSNGDASIPSVAAPNLSSNSSDLNSNSDSVDGNDDDDGWEFKSAQWETGTKSLNVEAEVLKHDHGGVGVNSMLDSSTGILVKAGEWHLGFEFSPSSASQDHVSPQLSHKGESNETRIGFTIFNQNIGELKNAHSGSQSNQNLEAPQMADTYSTSLEVLEFDGGGPQNTIDQSLPSESHQPDEWDFGFIFNSSSLGKDSHISESYFKTKSNQDDDNRNHASPTNTNVDSDVNLFESRGAVTEIGTKDQKPQISSDNRREALPSSIFGDEMPDTEELSVSQDLSSYAPTSPIRNNFNSPGSNLSINDLIWSLYSQVENKTSPNVTPKASENGIHAFHGVPGSNLVTSDDDLDDDSWDFKNASSGTRFANESTPKSSFNHAPQVNENGLQSSPTVLNSNLINDDDDFDDDSWEFKDAILGTGSPDQASSIDNRDLPKQLSTKLEPLDYVDFYSKMKDELCNAVLFHLQNLKKARSAAALLGEDAKAKALQDEIQEFSEILHQDNIIPNEYLSENYSPKNVYFDELLEVLKEPKFQSLESEYQLATRLSMAEKDIKSAMELLKDAVSTLRILKLGSKEEQSNYLTTWSKIAFVCSQELKHGAYIWKQAVQKNVHDQILSNPKGVQYIHALGEIYRVAEIIGASAKLHKPWILLGSVDPTSLSACLNDCYSIWSGSGLEEALFSISNENNFEPDGISRELVESIKYIHELDEHTLQSYVISGEETTCQLSALPAGFIPGLKMVTWNGKHYFVMLANLWVNLISSEPPTK